jgi:FkbM family methyltransferase
MELSRDGIYNSYGQRIAWLSHFLKARFKCKERPRVQMLSQFFGPNSVVFDIGAHFGYLSKEFCRLYDASCQVHAFEPVEYTRSILRHVVGGLDNAVIVENALSDREVSLNISIPVKKSGKLGIGLSHFGTESNLDYVLEPIKTVTMDSYVIGQHLQRLDFIKCDVEGAEFLAFKGGETSIEKFKPVVYCELVNAYTRILGYEAQEVIDFFKSKGYQAFSISNGGEKVSVEYHSEEEQDYIFIPN